MSFVINGEYSIYRRTDGRDPINEPCESCGTRLWLWHCDDPGQPSRSWREYDPAVLTVGVEHTVERCRWRRGDPSTTWGPPPV